MRRSIALVAFASIVIGASPGVRAENTRGLCNSIIANAFGSAQQFVNGIGDPAQQCTEVGDALLEFLNTPGCFDAFVAGDVKGLAGPASTQPAGPDAGTPKPVGDTICGALCGCGFFPSLPPPVCGAFSCP